MRRIGAGCIVFGRAVYSSSQLNVSKDVIAHIPSIGTRFSNFGRLYTIYSDSSELEKYSVNELRRIVDSFGWKYVDPKDLNEPYDGVREDLRNDGISWWRRFFDYL